MYIDTGTMIAIIIALTTSMAVIIMSYSAHKKLLNKYENLRNVIEFFRKDCENNHVKVPF